MKSAAWRMPWQKSGNDDDGGENPRLFPAGPRTVVSGRGSDAPCGEGSQKGDGEYRREQKAGPRKTSKPRLPKLKR